MKQEITGFTTADKEAVIRLRLTVQSTERKEVVLLLVSYERYWDLRYDVFGEEYGGGGGNILTEFHDYLDSLLERIAGWAQAENLADIEQRSTKARGALQQAMKSVKKKSAKK